MEPYTFDDHLQYLIENKDHRHSFYGECWAIIDGAMVIYQEDNIPAWLAVVLASRDEDGDTPTNGLNVSRSYA